VAALLDTRATLTPADLFTHRRFAFSVPPRCQALQVHVAYAPKHLAEDESKRLGDAALAQQRADLASRVGEQLAAAWLAGQKRLTHRRRLTNLVTLSLDDASSVYRGAAHRHAAEQDLLLGPDEASPGLVPGPLPPGVWTLTMSVQSLVSAQCELSIQIGAETASSR
jgi:hypothetical protein